MTRFSLILATVGRTVELTAFLTSLEAQNYSALELIVVDQNPDDRLLPILARYRDLPVTHLRAAAGLSRARNVGLERATGDVVAFPDDDCAYPPGLLSRVAALLEAQPDLAGVSGRATTGDGATSVGRFDAEAGPIDARNVWRRGVSITLFLRRAALKGVRFDETLGAGTPWGSGEETDLLLTLLAKRAKLWYSPDLHVHHPPTLMTFGPHMNQKAYRYGLGMGRVVRRHGYPVAFKLRLLLRPLGGSVLFTVAGRPGKAAYHWWTFRGRLDGLRLRTRDASINRTPHRR